MYKKKYISYILVYLSEDLIFIEKKASEKK